jgi:hypothetical protein
MADSRLRRLERLADLGDLDARVRLLSARVRCGTLVRERVRLAAHLGDPAARRVLGIQGGASDGSNDGLTAADGLDERALSELRCWVRGLRGWAGGGLLVARAALAAARYALTVWAAARPTDLRAQALVDAASEWACCPCPAHAHQVQAAQESWPVVDGVRGLRVFYAGYAARMAAETASVSASQNPARAHQAAHRAASGAVFAAKAVGPGRVRLAIQAELLPWALLDTSAPYPALSAS